MKASLSLAALALVGGFGAANLASPNFHANQGLGSERKVVSHYAEFPAGNHVGWTTISVTRTTAQTVFTDFVISQPVPYATVQLTVNGAPAFAFPPHREPVHLVSGIPVPQGAVIAVRIKDYGSSDPISCTLSGYAF